MPSSTERTRRLDALAVFLSGACMVHCLALPLLFTLFPILQGSLLEESYFHMLMLLLVVPTSTIALSVGCRRHKDLATIVLGTIGLVILTITAVFGHELFGYVGERIATTIGGLVLSCAHIRNYLKCREVDCQHDHGA
ncbi:MAG: MerC domain-containing protein [Pseudomonadales bacterium]|nr:MerC domain-containing protein [Pseudomonadales bacterium]